MYCPSVIYFPAMASVLSWVTARYTLEFIVSVNPDFPLLIPASEGGCMIGPECMILTLFFLAVAYIINALSPKIAGKVQTSTTVIKLIPLLLMAVVGILVGLLSPTKMLVSNFATASIAGSGSGSPLLASVCATAFAYEGWIIATSINSELKDAKRNLPRALIIGGIIIIVTYIAYYIGVAGGASVEDLMNVGASVAFVNIFGGVLGNILNLFVAVSCFGTLNGLMVGCARGMYSLAARGEGPAPELFGQVDKTSNMAHNSAVFALFICAFWAVYFCVTQLFGTWSSIVVFEGTPFASVPFSFDSSELPIITIYAFYIPIFIQWMKKATDETTMRRYVIPALAVCGSAFMVYACLAGHKMANFWYIIVFAVFMLIGRYYKVKTEKAQQAK